MTRQFNFFLLGLLLIGTLSYGQNSNHVLKKANFGNSNNIKEKSEFVGRPTSGHSSDQSLEIGEKCLQNKVTEELMERNPDYRRGVEEARDITANIIREIESGERTAPPIYTIPVVFHVIHKGESVGSGTNISDAQIMSAIDALNRDYRTTSADGGIGQGAGPDTEIQFCLAGFDPQGNPHSGINRVNGTVVSGYSSNGISTGIGGNDVDVKALSNWDNRYYLNIWVVSEIDGNGADISNLNNFTGGTLGYAYLPQNPITAMSDIDGVVALNCSVGNDPNGSNGYRLWFATTTNRTLTHEVGHYLGLSHTFSDNNPSACLDGDGIGDTPNAKQVGISTCTSNGTCTNQMIENYMDYTPEQCQNQFTNGQNSVMRGTLAGVRNALVNTNNCGATSSNDYDAGISAISAPTGTVCSTTFTPTVTLNNYGSTTLTSVQIQYFVDANGPTTYPWSGSLSPNSSTTVTLNSLTTSLGSHTFTAKTVSGTLNGSNTDQDTGNDQSTGSFTSSDCNGSSSCDPLFQFDGEYYYINNNDAPNFEMYAIDNDQEAIDPVVVYYYGYDSNWMLNFYESAVPGDTNWFIGSTSLHQDITQPADNWLTFGPVTMLDGDGELRWKHMMASNNYRDGYEVLVGTTGTDVADFSGATVLFSVSDNDASTDGDTIWTPQSVPLPSGSYAFQSLYFAFHHNALDQTLLFLDDIEVEGCTSLTVGIEESESFDFQVYPNPSNGNFTYRFKAASAQDITFTMVNSVGQTVWAEQSKGQMAGTSTISTEGIAAGVYTLMVRSDKLNVSERLILTK